MKSLFRLPVPLQVLVPVPMLAHRSKASSAGKHRAQTHIFWKWKREQRQRQWQRIIAIITKAALHKFKFQFCLSFHESLSNQGRYSSAHCRLYFVIMEQPLSLNSEEREQIIVNCHLWKSESAEKKFLQFHNKLLFKKLHQLVVCFRDALFHCHLLRSWASIGLSSEVISGGKHKDLSKCNTL